MPYNNYYYRIVSYLRRDGVNTKIQVVFIKFIQAIRILSYKLISNNANVTSSAKINQPVLFCGRGSIKLGGCNIGIWPSPYFLSTYAHIEARTKTANIIIGDESWFNNNAVIIADKKTIEIGNNVLIGANFFLTDSDFHSLEIDKRLGGEYSTASVLISDNVFIGSNVSVLKGVTIGKNTVIANGAIVTMDIPENVVAGGIPAKIIRQL